MRTKRTTLDFESNRFTSNLHVVMEQLEPRVLSNADPYDASPTKVREGADSADIHHELAVPSSYRCQRVFDLTESLVGLIAEEFEREVKQRLAHPRELRRAITERRCRFDDIATHVGREIDREEKTHAEVLRRFGGRRQWFVERARAESARIDVRPSITGRNHGRLETLPRFAARPLAKLIRRELDARDIAEMSDPQVTDNSELANCSLGPFDAL